MTIATNDQELDALSASGAEGLTFARKAGGPDDDHLLKQVEEEVPTAEGLRRKVGLIGAGVVAIPILLASTSYAVAGTFGWPASLWKKPWQNEGFYLILSAAIGFSLILALLRLDPIQLMFWANVLQGILSPVLVVFLLLVGNNRKIMRHYRLGRLNNAGLIVTALLMFAAALLFYGLVSGQ